MAKRRAEPWLVSREWFLGYGVNLRCLTAEECDQWRQTHSRRRQWKRQLTCETPSNRLPWYTRTLVERLHPFDAALLIIDQVVMSQPEELLRLRGAAGEHRPIREAPGHLFENDPGGFREVLEATLEDWIDFRVLFSPAHHALRADHDEYTTVFSKSAGKIAEVRSALEKGGVTVQEYTAVSP